MKFGDYEVKSAETLYDEWCISEEAVSSRMEALILFTNFVKTEREQAFIAGFRSAMKQANEMMKSEIDKDNKQ